MTEVSVKLSPGLSEDQVDMVLKQIRVLQGVREVDVE